MRLLAAVCLLAPSLAACGGGGSAGSDGGGGGTLEMYLNDANLSVLELTLLKGRCCARLVVNAKTPEAQAAIEAFGRQLAQAIPGDGSGPKSDAALVDLVPKPPLSGDLASWIEDPNDTEAGPWIVTTSAYDWIDGSGVPFEDHGFEAAAGERYLHEVEGWRLTLDLVYLTDIAGADAAFHEAGWDTGTKYE